MRVDSALQQAAVQAVARAAQSSGVDFGALLEMAKRESGLDQNARAKTSSAAGLFQFIESTWLDLAQRYGPSIGLGSVDAKDPARRQRLLDMRYDPEIASRMAGALTKENNSVLSAKLGRAPSAGELYAAHVLGPEGAASLINAANAQSGGSQSAAALLPKAAAANHAIFYASDGSARSPQAVLEKLALSGEAAAPVAPAANVQSSAQAQAPAAYDPAAALAAASALTESFGRDLWALALRAYGSSQGE